MKSFIKHISFSLLLLLVSFIVSCTGKESICGHWETTGLLNGEEITLSYEFNEDGTGCRSTEGFSADSFTYELSEKTDEVFITVGTTTETVEYILGKETLSLNLDGQNIIFYRSDSQ